MPRVWGVLLAAPEPPQGNTVILSEGAQGAPQIRAKYCLGFSARRVPVDSGDEIRSKRNKDQSGSPVIGGTIRLG